MRARARSLSLSRARSEKEKPFFSRACSGWLNGDAVGGYYSKFIAPPTARSKLGPGLGCWPANCGPKATPHPCWSTTAASGPPRMARIASDDLPEVALFRIIQVPGRPDLQWVRK